MRLIIDDFICKHITIILGDAMDYMKKRIEYIEKELKTMKKMAKNGMKNHVSFSGIARTSLNMTQLDEEITKSISSALFPLDSHVKGNVIVRS